MSAFPAINSLVPDPVSIASIAAMLEAGEGAAAVGAVDRLLARHPDDDDLLNVRGQVAMLTDDAATARAWFEAALARNPARTDTLCNLAVAAHAQGDLDTAEQCYRCALALAPAMLLPALQLGALLAARSQFEQAVKVLWTGHRAICDDVGAPRVADDLVLLNELMRLRPREPAVLLALGRAHAALGHDAVARACYLRLQRVPSWGGPAMAGLVALETPASARPWP